MHTSYGYFKKAHDVRGYHNNVNMWTIRVESFVAHREWILFINL